MKIEIIFFFFVYLDEYDIRKEDAKEYAYIRTMPIQTITVKIVIDFFGTEYSFAPITYVCFFFFEIIIVHSFLIIFSY